MFSQGKLLLIQQNLLVYFVDEPKVTFRNLIDQIQKYVTPQTRSLDSEEIANFAYLDQLQKFMPSGYFKYGNAWMPEVLTQDTFKKAGCASSCMAVTVYDSRGELAAVSFGQGCKVPLGMKYDLNYYGTGNLQLLLSHVTLQLRHLVRILSDGMRVGLLIHFPEDIDIETTENELLPLGRPDTPFYKVKKAAIARADLKHKL